jgi:5'-3' exonuclease
MKKIVIIDALNLFIRNYVVNPTMDTKGVSIGGCIGFLKSLQKITRILKPDQVMICWDGVGGSQRRKSKNKNYKEGRSPIRFNRRMIQLDPESQEQNRVYQQIRLCEYLNEMPVIQVAIDGLEADDIIGYVVNQKYYSDWEKVIVSSDKDFFQLVTDKTTVYRPIQNTYMTVESLLEKDKVHPKNYALARAMVGDKSDNLPGVPRIGMKTVAKMFSFLREAKQHELQSVLDVCEAVDKKTVAQKNILNNVDLIQDNYNIMQLYDPKMSYTTKQAIDYQIQEFEFDFVKINVTKMLHTDGQGSLNFTELFGSLKRMAEEGKK